METEQEEVVVQTDAKWMRFVLNQLMTNGIKYSRNQPGSQTLQIRVFEDEVGWHVSIRDEGIGIPKEDLPRVFDAFFTGANGREFPESTGMGLYLAKQVCDRLGHRLRLQSEVGEGTTATVTFLKNRHVHER
jgi:signal transduction histidine kinase